VAYFDLVASGYSHRQIATAMKVSLATVRREVDKALAERPILAPERYVTLQVARLTKALSYADLKLERGDVRAFGPYMKVLAALDRYHGFDGRLGLPGAAQTRSGLAAPPPLALTHAAEPEVPPLPSEVADFAAQDVEIVGAPIDIPGLAERDGDAPLALAAAEPALAPLPSEVAQSGPQGVEIARGPVDIARLACLAGRNGDAPLALAQAEPALPPLPSEVAQSGAQGVEIAGGPIDIAWSVG
jgi:hypothetical protein